MSYRVPASKQDLDKKIQEVAPLAAVFDLIDTHIVVTDEHGNIVYMNKAAENTTGYSKEESLGKNPGDLWGGQEDDEFFKKMWRTIKVDKKSFVGKVKNIKKDGSQLYQHINITPILEENGNIKYFIAIETNITGEVESKNELQKNIDTFFSVTVSRELKMDELKEKLNALSLKNDLAIK